MKNHDPFLKMLEGLPDLKPCDLCGRVVLAGWCCDAAKQKAKRKAKS